MIETAFLIYFALTQNELFESDVEKDYEIMLMELERLREEPFDINSVTLNELARLPYLSVVLAYRIVQYRGEVGFFSSLEDLLKIDGLNQDILDRISPYVQVKKKAIKSLRFSSRIRDLNDLTHEPSGEKVYTRNLIAYDDRKAYLVTEKDHGEENYLDYAGFGMVVEEPRRGFGLGSYNLDFARGLVLGSQPTIFQGTDYQLVSSSRGVVPYTSVVEDGGFFGGAYSDSFLFNYTLFYSNKALDGRLDSSGNVTSLDHSGLHVDSLSLSRRHNLREEILGFSFEKTLAATELGIRSYYLKYSRPFSPDDSQHSYYGNQLFMTGANTGYLTSRFYLFSEVAHSLQNRWAGLAGFIGDYSPVEVSLVFNYFMKGFYSPKGEVMGEDEALAIGDLKVKTGLFHLETNVEMTKPLEADTTGYQIKIGIERPWPLFTVKCQFRRRYNETRVRSNGSMVNLKFHPVKSGEIYLRLEEKYVYQEGFEKGAAYFLGGQLKYRGFTLESRFGMFETESYASRLFVYEPDLTGVINNGQLYGDGTQWFVLGCFAPVKSVELQAKYAEMDKETRKQSLGLQFEVKI